MQKGLEESLTICYLGEESFCLACYITTVKLWVGGFMVGLDLHFCSKSDFCSLILSREYFRPAMVLLSFFQFDLLIGTSRTLV